MFSLFARIKNALNKPGNDKNTFIFPYADDKFEKREQLWGNLQKGILLEDSGVLIPWGIPYEEVDNLKESKKIRADRVEWSLGKRIILGGYESSLTVTQWLWKTTDALTKFDEDLGIDAEGMEKFNYLKAYLLDKLGNPVKEELTKFGSFDIGDIVWENGIVVLSLTGIEKINCRYSFHISLVNN